MYYEKLALEVGATVAGFSVVKPAVIRGASGVEHRFTFVAADGSQFYAFDVCREAGEIEVLRAYVKKMDTGARTFLICLSGRAVGEAKEMARDYGIEILNPSQVGDFFSGRIAQKISSLRASTV